MGNHPKYECECSPSLDAPRNHVLHPKSILFCGLWEFCDASGLGFLDISRAAICKAELYTFTGICRTVSTISMGYLQVRNHPHLCFTDLIFV